jgi:hypothetical protein
MISSKLLVLGPSEATYKYLGLISLILLNTICVSTGLLNIKNNMGELNIITYFNN